MVCIPTLKHRCMSFIAERRIRFKIDYLPRHLVVEFLASYCKDSLFASFLAGALFSEDVFLQRLCTEASSFRSPRATNIKKEPTPFSTKHRSDMLLAPLVTSPLTRKLIDRYRPAMVCSNGEELCYVHEPPLARSDTALAVLQLPDKQMVFNISGTNVVKAGFSIAPYEVSKFQLWATCHGRFICWILDPLLQGDPRYIPPERTVFRKSGSLRFIGERPCVMLVTSPGVFDIVSLYGERLYSSTNADHGPIVKLAKQDKWMPVHETPHRIVKWKEEEVKWVPFYTDQLTADRLSTRVWSQFPVKKGGYEWCVYSEE